MTITKPNTKPNTKPIQVPTYCPCCLAELWNNPENGRLYCPDWFLCDFESGDHGQPDEYGQQPLTLLQMQAEMKTRQQKQLENNKCNK